ncbi:MAG: phosphoribosylformylglycinamidine cyclo-ligase [Planctomycetota bacterium]|nr:phosphoribosylformylglycinamidine cyclo-ligase [Planctomycetota bacterium]
MSKATYKDAGVDLDIYRQSMARLPRLMQRTFTPRVMELEGGFAGLFQVDFNQGLFARTYKQPVLVSGTDGVGTKLQVAKRTGIHNTIGIDLVAMCVNDIICCGAEPLFFLDYIAMSQDDPERLEQVVQGISDGCVNADCSLLGGETAIMPDLYRKGDYDLAGFCVGIVEKDDLIDGSQMEPGDVVIGVASDGLHSNGFSLVRKIVFDIAGLTVRSRVEEFGKSVGQILLTPTRIYAQPVRRILKHYTVKNVVHGIAHVTGGGIQENLERVIPEGVHAELARNSWEIPPVFKWIQQLGDVDNEEMDRVFNLGIGLVLVVSNYYADNIQRILKREGLESWKLGEIKSGGSGASWS